MRQTDIAIIGGGVAGATAAAMLGRKGIDALLIDPHPVCAFDFRCEKLDASQIKLLNKTGLTEGVLKNATPDAEVWIVRHGRLAEKRPNGQFDLLYDTLVNSVRAEIPPTVPFVQAKVTELKTSPDRQTVMLSNGEEISARLIVLATGLNHVLRSSLGIERKNISHCHSVSIGFDLKPVGRPSFDFRALTYYPERVSDRMAYMTLFPLRDRMRANLFVYRDPRDRWLKTLRQQREEALFELMPRLKTFTGEIEIMGDIHIRPVDMIATEGYRQPGVVLVGDAFCTSCPAAGTGVNKVFTDVERLCNVHIPNWLASEGMGTAKIGAFYDDPVKRACDAHSASKAFFLRSLSTDGGAIWGMRRFARSAARAGFDMVRRARDTLSSKPLRPEPSRMVPADNRGASEAI